MLMLWLLLLVRVILSFISYTGVSCFLPASMKRWHGNLLACN